MRAGALRRAERACGAREGVCQSSWLTFGGGAVHALAESQANLEELRRDLAASKFEHHSYTEGADGAEAWVADAILAEDIRETHQWWHPVAQRWENEDETLLRNRIYHHLTTQLPNELYSQHPEGDVKAIYLNIVSLGTKDAAEQVLELEKSMLAISKEGRPMAVYLNEMYEILAQLSVLGHPHTVAQIRVTIFANLKSDKRYENVVRDLKQNTHWDMAQIRRTQGDL